MILGFLSGGSRPEVRRRTMVSPLTPVMMAGSASRWPAIPFLPQFMARSAARIGSVPICRRMFRECDAVYPVSRLTLRYLRRATCHGF
jgi:hypothetical protein